jgi:hypothetical protein
MSKASRLPWGIPAEGKALRQLLGATLAMEGIVIGLAIGPAIVLEHANHALAGGVGGALAVLAILLSGVVGRPHMSWALYAGTFLQVLAIASGVVVHAMYVLGVIFAALWIIGIWLARKHTPADPAPAGPVPVDPGAPAPSSTPDPAATPRS